MTLRSPRAAFFTFVFPLVLLVLLDATSGDSTVSVPGGKVDFAQYFTPSIAIYALTVGLLRVADLHPRCGARGRDPEAGARDAAQPMDLPEPRCSPPRS